jgi:two-component sensor histidine kinase
VVASSLDRLAVLERNHERLSASPWRGCGLKVLVTEELAPYSALTNVQLEGPDIPLNAAAAQSLSMVLHELATNAAKHGAWSNSNGRVLVRWGIERNDDGTQHVIMAWQEENGPPVLAPPSRKGFGSLVIGDLLRMEFEAQVTLSYPAAGLKCRIALPLANVGHRD